MKEINSASLQFHVRQGEEGRIISLGSLRALCHHFSSLFPSRKMMIIIASKYDYFANFCIFQSEIFRALSIY